MLFDRSLLLASDDIVIIFPAQLRTPLATKFRVQSFWSGTTEYLEK
jgi:hypothetical protein